MLSTWGHTLKFRSFCGYIFQFYFQLVLLLQIACAWCCKRCQSNKCCKSLRNAKHTHLHTMHIHMKLWYTYKCICRYVCIFVSVNLQSPAQLKNNKYCLLTARLFVLVFVLLFSYYFFYTFFQSASHLFLLIVCALKMVLMPLIKMLNSHFPLQNVLLFFTIDVWRSGVCFSHSQSDAVAVMILNSRLFALNVRCGGAYEWNMRRYNCERPNDLTTNIILKFYWQSGIGCE